MKISLAVLAASAALTFAVTPAFAAEPAACTLNAYAQLPVAMVGLRPMVTVKLDGHEARFILDSGSFYSIISKPAAEKLGLKITAAPPDFALVSGGGGVAESMVARAETFQAGTLNFHGFEFLAIDSSVFDDGVVGLLGENVLNEADAEYDLANGVVRLFQAKGDCRNTARAYWSDAYAVLPIKPTNALNSRVVGDVTVNGKTLTAMFDTGAGVSGMTLKAADRLGITPRSPGVQAAGKAHGIGDREYETWTAPVESFSIGGETIKNTHLRVSSVDLTGTADMLIGPDFFLSHRIYIAKDQGRLYLTYNGGPVFDLGQRSTTASTAAGSAPATATTGTISNGPADADGLARRGDASMVRGDYVAAIADYGRAAELEPSVAKHFTDLARAHSAAGQPALVIADLSQALKLAPDDVRSRLQRGRLYFEQGDEIEAHADYDTALAQPVTDPAEWLLMGTANFDMGRWPAAISYLDRWIAANPNSGDLARALNLRALSRAYSGQELDEALLDCEHALRLQPKTAAYLTSCGQVRLRLGRIDAAIADFDAALALEPKHASTLYVRGVAKQRKGLAAEGAADMAEATAMDAKGAKWAKDYGLTGLKP